MLALLGVAQYSLIGKILTKYTVGLVMLFETLTAILFFSQNYFNYWQFKQILFGIWSESSCNMSWHCDLISWIFQNYFINPTLKKHVSSSYLLCYLSICLSRLFWCELLSFGNSSSRDVCHLLNIVELDSTWLVVLTAPKHRNVCFRIIMAWLLKVIRRHSQKFHVWTAVLSCRVSMLFSFKVFLA